MEELYLAGGCLWGVQEFIKTLPGVVSTEAGRANGSTDNTTTDYDGYAECVLTRFDSSLVSVEQLVKYFFEIIDPYSVNKQGEDTGEKYRTGIYSKKPNHLVLVTQYFETREDTNKIAIEVLPLSNYVKSDDEHQDRLTLHPGDYCHIPKLILYKYKDE